MSALQICPHSASSLASATASRAAGRSLHQEVYVVCARARARAWRPADEPSRQRAYSPFPRSSSRPCPPPARSPGVPHTQPRTAPARTSYLPLSSLSLVRTHSSLSLSLLHTHPVLCAALPQVVAQALRVLLPTDLYLHRGATELRLHPACHLIALISSPQTLPLRLISSNDRSAGSPARRWAPGCGLLVAFLRVLQSGRLKGGKGEDAALVRGTLCFCFTWGSAAFGGWVCSDAGVGEIYQ